jgi:hypothetical protein
MLAEFFKSLYSVGIQLAPSKAFDWMSILSYFRNLIAKHHRYKHHFSLALVLPSLATYQFW